MNTDILLTPAPEKLIHSFLKNLMAQGRSPHTIRNYQNYLVEFHTFLATRIFNGDYTIQDVTFAEFEQFLCYLKLEKKNANKTVYTKLTGIQSFYNYLERRNYCIKNVPRSLEKIRVEKKEREYLTPQEMTRLLHCIDHPIIYAICATIMYSGLRISEICNLRYSDVDLENMEIFVHSGKGKKDRIVPVSAELKEILSEYQQQVVIQNKEYFFSTSRSEGSISQQYIDSSIRKYVKLAGINKKISAHSLRHSCASALASNGCSVVSIQKILGHASLKTTSIYTHSSKQELISSVNSLNLKGETIHGKIETLY